MAAEVGVGFAAAGGDRDPHRPAVLPGAHVAATTFRGRGDELPGRPAGHRSRDPVGGEQQLVARRIVEPVACDQQCVLPSGRVSEGVLRPAIEVGDYRRGVVELESLTVAGHDRDPERRNTHGCSHDHSHRRGQQATISPAGEVLLVDEVVSAGGRLGAPCRPATCSTPRR